MTIRRSLPWAALLLYGAALLASLLYPAAAAAAERFVIGYLTRAGDPFYERRRAYPGLILYERRPAIEAAELALRDSRVLGRALGLTFALAPHELGEGESAAEAIELLRAGQGDTEPVVAFIVDLPLEEVRALARDFAGEPLLFFNARHPDNELRQEACSPALFHTLPSRAMAMDALAQYLFHKDWREVLLLVGESAEDQATAAAFEAAARKFRLKIVARRDFVLSNDPRRRDQTNVPLLTGGIGYDLVFLADSEGEFGRYVAYSTYHPRPLIGSQGLSPSAWHWTWERHGAPQLNQRFDRKAGRHMGERDWAAWAAVKSLVEAVVRTGQTDVEALRAYLRSDAFVLDSYKGNPSSFRAWNNQLRQPLLLHTHNAVIARAPLEGFLHQTNVLDTLGVDAAESRCELER